MTTEAPVEMVGVDLAALSALHAQIPEGPYSADRRGDGHEVRQLDTDPTNKHHWPYRLLASIPGQHAACDDAVFDFVAGVINAWPQIAELCERSLATSDLGGVLPCDVHLPPATRIRAGCKLSVLMTALRVRAHTTTEPTP